MHRLRQFTITLCITLLLGVFTLVIVRSQSGALRRITNTAEEGISINPSLSGDGRRLAFESTEDIANAGGNDLFRFLRADLTGNSQTFAQLGATRAPAAALSQDGSFVAFASKDDPLGTNADGNSEIFFYDGVRLGQITITSPADLTTRTRDGNFQPSISDDGRFIAFASNRNLAAGGNADANLEIFVYDTSAGTFTQLTNTIDTIGATDAKISGDGSRIAYINDSSATTGATQRDLILQDRVGGTQRIVSAVTNIAFTYGRAISDDGARVVYAADTAANRSQVFLYDARDNSTRQITALTARTDDVPLHPTISGNGSRIAFATRRNVNGSNPDPSIEVYVYDSPTNQFVRVTDAPATASGFDGTTSSARRLAEVVSSLNDDGSSVAFNFPRTLSGTVSETFFANNSEIYLASIQTPLPAPTPSPSPTPKPSPTPAPGTLTIVNGASFGTEPATTKAIAPDSISIAFGQNLSDTTTQTTRQADGSFPQSVGGTTLTVNNRAAQLLFVSPTQINFIVPAQTEPGTAQIIATNSSGTQSRGSITIVRAAPGIFTQSEDGRGEAVALDADSMMRSPFDPSSGTRRVVIFTTGLRNASQVSVTIGNRSVTVERFAASQNMPGMDEVQILLPADLRAGTQNLVIRADDRDSNTARITIGGNATSQTPVVISEFRTRGPNGASDEFIELYNNTDNSVDISGWKIKGSNNSGSSVTTRLTVNASTTIPARGHFLATNSASSGYSGAVAGNQTYGVGIADDGGIALTMPNDAIVDQVGLSSGSAFKEGTTLQPLTTPSTNQSYERKPGGAQGSTQDTDDNASDFQLRTPSDPQNLSSTQTPVPIATPTPSPSPSPTPTPSPTPNPSPTPSPTPSPSPATPSAFVISQIYGGGGNSGAPLRCDFVEIFNRGTATIDFAATPFSLQYASATGNFGSSAASNKFDLTIGSIASGQYYLVQGACGATGSNLSTADAVSSLSLAQSAGKVALVAGTTPLPAVPCPTDESIADFVGYGTTATCFEGTNPAPAPGSTTADMRNAGGCTDTDNNAADFSTAPPAPRNTASPLNSCSGTPSPTPTPAPSPTPTPTPTPSPSPSPVPTPSPSPTPSPVPSPSPATPSALAISQVYGGGGNSGATYKNDFIELFNRGTDPVDITGWSVQYTSATGTTWQVTPLCPTGTCVIAAGQYFLVQEAQGSGGTTNLPTPDAIGTIALAATSGKVALVNSTVALSASGCPFIPSIIDFVGYGTTADCFEGNSPAPAPSATVSDLRKTNGCTDTNDNAADFETAAPMPRNSSTPVNLCGGNPNPTPTPTPTPSPSPTPTPSPTPSPTPTPTPSPSPTPTPVNSGEVVISEFRTRGPNGANDEFIELYNPTASTVTIGGLKINGSNSTGTTTTRATITAGTTLGSGCHYLLALITTNCTTCYSGATAPDQTYSSGITDDGGIAIVRSDNVIIDQVGLSSGSAYKEGTPLAPLAGTTNQSYERKPGGAAGNGTDTNNNAADFFLNSGTSNPQNSASGCLNLNAADLAITKADSPDPVTPGGNITYTINVNNNGAGAAQSVVVTDNLPNGLTFVSCSSTSGGVCVGTGNNQTATFTSLASGASATIAIVATVDNSLASGTTITNTASVASSTTDPNTANNSATQTTTVESLAVISINDVTVAEGNAGTTNATFTVSLATVSSRIVTVTYATADGTATAGSDYVATSGTLTFAPGETIKTFSVTVNGDTQIEPNETFFVNLSGATNATISDAQGIGTITNDDAPSISISDASVTEGNSGAVTTNFTVTLSAASTQTVTVDYATADNTANASSDYVATNGTLTFAPGQTSQTITVTVRGDMLDEPDETFYVNLSNPSNATITDNQGVGTILDDDAAPTISIDDTSVIEGNSGATSATFTVTLSAASGQTVTVDYATGGGTATAGSDYVATNGTLTFAPGETTKTINVTVNGDTLVEPNETFFVNLTNPANATIADNQGAGTITNDDTGPAISISDATVTEGNTSTTVSAVFTVTLSQASAQTVTVAYSTQDGTATAGADYVAQSGTLTFNAGETSKTIEVVVNGDNTDEVDEQFSVNLSGATNATIADALGIGTITDDDAPPALSINDVTVTEGNSGQTNATFTVTLSAASGQTVTVAYTTQDGTATAGSDYTATSGTLTFTAGETSKTITVLVNGDTNDEGNETFNVILSNAASATITDAQGTGTIANDDALILISISNASVTEGDAGTVPATFTVTLSQASTQTVQVNYATANGTATAGSDYVTTSGTLTFNPGETSRTITVLVNGDTIDEANETFFVNLSNATNASISAAQGVGTITDDDAAPTLSINNATVTEGNSGQTNATFTVTLSAASEQTVTVNYATANGTATAGSDYAATSGTLSFTPGVTSQNITVAVNGDTLDEADETFTVTLSNATNASITTATGIGTITDDDAAPTLSIGNATVTEGNSGTVSATFTVTLSNASGQTVTVAYTTADNTATIANNDYQAASGTLNFTPGVTSQTITVLVNGDTQVEPNETFLVNLSDATNATISAAQGTGTITNDDFVIPAISISDATVTEGNAGTTTTATFTVTLSQATTQAVSVQYATADGTATAGSDYVATSGTLTFAANETSKTISVTVNGDTTVEPNETFFVNLTNPTNATIADNQGVGTITNDDVAVSADLSITKTDSPDPVAIGNDITYTVTVTNGGPNAASSVTLTDTVPTNTTFRSIAAPTGWSCTNPAVGATGTVTCTNASLSSGASAVFTLIVRVGAAVADGTTISNTASISSSTADPNSANNTATTTTTAKTPMLVISQIYPGGGNAGATYTNDFIEIFNRGTTTVDFLATNYSVQYTSQTGNFGGTTASVKFNITSGTIAPGQYFLIQGASSNGCTSGTVPCGVALPTPDATSSIALAATAGKVALVLGTAALPAFPCPGDDGNSPFNPNNPVIVDFVGYGGTAASTTCYEGSGPAPFSTSTAGGLNPNARSTIRASSCQDNNDNSTDFTNPTTAPTARNSTTTKTPCP